ncbi:MAG TPA: trypsin-like peptidase domain-containing protein [Planctomycetaceae bacterium]|nr:trypsin-like peptidase domain-containing protein [Planctomycetaceae bacterium]
MNHFARTNWTVRGWLALAALLLSSPAWAQRLPGSRLKDGADVLKVFKPVVAQAAEATVRVRRGERELALGTIVATDGYILTKASELEANVTCRLPDGREFDAALVGIHHDYDLALLKIEAEGLPVIAWQDSREPRVGQLLATPGDGAAPVAVGVLSVADRRIPQQRGVLGISIAEGNEGPEITQVHPESGAEKAGLQAGDIIKAVAGSVISSGRALTENIEKFRPGDRLQLVIRRGESEQTLEAILGYPGINPLNRGDLQNLMGGELSLRRGGFPAAIQHDSVLDPKDCGGPLVELSGKAIGINIARAGRTESYAIPARDVIAILDDLKSGKLAPPPALASTSQASAESSGPVLPRVAGK